MDYNHCDHFNYLLTRKCACGGDSEMLVDFVADFVVRCSKCHLSTHAYIKPEDAAVHWNDGSDIMDTPLDIFWDDPEGYLEGDVVAIHISDDWFMPISKQSCDFCEAIFEYNGKTYLFEHEEKGECGTINIIHVSDFNPKAYKHTISPVIGETIRFAKIIYYDDGSLEGIAFRWGDNWLFVYAGESNLILTKSSFDLSNKSIYPEISVEPQLFT